MNVMATHLVTYKEDENESFKFYEMDDSEAGERIKLSVKGLSVKGLKVDFPLYRITDEIQVSTLMTWPMM